MADANQSGGDAGAQRAGYERLRAAVLSGEAGGWRLGHGVLSTRGVVGWMSAVGELLPAPVLDPAAGVGGAQSAPRPASAEGGQPPDGRLGSLPQAEQVVAVLAQMTLALAA